MDPPGEHDLNTEVSAQKLLENVQKARTMGLVDGIREATAGHEVDAEGQPLSVDLVRDLMYEVQGRGGIQREDTLLALHPAQFYILRDREMMLLEAETDHLEYQDGVTAFDGIPVLQDHTLPKAVVYLMDPNAITVAGTVMYENRVGRLTGLKHPDAYEK